MTKKSSWWNRFISFFGYHKTLDGKTYWGFKIKKEF